MFTSKVCSGRLYINNIVSGETVESLPELPDGTKEITCDECHHSFTFVPTYTTGDPRNIALRATLCRDRVRLKNCGTRLEKWIP